MMIMASVPSLKVPQALPTAATEYSPGEIQFAFFQVTRATHDLSVQIHTRVNSFFV